MYHKRIPYPCCVMLLLRLLSFTICGVGSVQAATVFGVGFVQPVTTYGCDVIYDDKFWAQVELSIAMIRTSPGRICASNCLGRSRSCKVRLIFPDGFRDLVLEKLGTNDITKSYFVVDCENKHKPGSQHIFFDFSSKVKSATDGRFYFERSANYGKVKGNKCFPQIYSKDDPTHYAHHQAVIKAPPTFILKGVIFENAEGHTVMLKPKKEPEAKSTRGKGAYYSCSGPFDTQAVTPWNDHNEIVLSREFSAATASEQ